MLVTAAPGHRVPRADDPRKYIECDPAEPVDVPDNSYYQRRIAAGELIGPKPSGAKKPAKRAVK